MSNQKNRQKLLASLARDCPLAYRQFFGRKYLLPNYRAKDYGDQEFESLISFDRVLQFAGAIINTQDDVQKAALGTTIAALEFKRPTLFLERELGEAFLRAPLPGDFTTGDIKWRWDAFKIWLPLGLVSIERPDGIRSLTHFDVCQIGPDDKHEIKCPRELALEMDRFSAGLGQLGNLRVLETIGFKYKDDGICISAALDRPELETMTQTMYGLIKPWGAFKISDYQAIKGSLKSPIGKDEVDDKLLNRLEHLVLQVLLFLGAVPFEYETTSRMIRPMKREGKNLHPGLFDARFVGQSQLRPYRPSEPRATLVGSQPTGRHPAAHWVSGHWKRVVYGPQRAERRLQWIMTYTTHDPEEEQEKEKVNK